VTLKLFARAIRDTAGARLGRRPLMMAMLGRPGEVAAFTAEEDFESMRALEAAAPEWRNAMAARSLFSLLRYKPVKVAGQVRIPLLRYPGGHFSAYRGEVFEHMVADEIAFLSEHLRARSSAAT